MTSDLLRPYPDFEEIQDGLILQSPCKINLSLRIVGKREDGYHELDTVFQELDWYDQLEIRHSDAFRLAVSGADLPVDNSNLVTRAAHLLAREAGVPCRAEIGLTKNLPLQGGVGGGSSNASLTLWGLNRLWGLGWPQERLASLAGQLGADCPFFIWGGLARATGRGDAIWPLSGALVGHILLLLPPFGVNTAWAFSQVRLPLTEVEKNVIFNPLLISGEGGVSDAILPCNDLENIVFQEQPALRDARDRLLDCGASVSLLSGSGSSVFGLFATEEAACDAARKLLQYRPDWRAKVCRPVARQREI